MLLKLVGILSLLSHVSGQIEYADNYEFECKLKTFLMETLIDLFYS